MAKSKKEEKVNLEDYVILKFRKIENDLQVSITQEITGVDILNCLLMLLDVFFKGGNRELTEEEAENCFEEIKRAYKELKK